MSRLEDGIVTAVTDAGVAVLFDNPTPKGALSRGLFDAIWFRIHPYMLRRLS